ncbi:MAG: c-type cytochrome [Bradymonadaceae bacterium]
MNAHRKLLIIALLATAVTLFGCDSSGTSTSTTAASTAPSADDGKGPASIDHGGITSVSTDAEFVNKGEALYLAKGCSACHQMDQRVVGPPLRGVTKKRAPEWLARMLLNPEQMVKEDPIAKQLLDEYKTPMPGANLTPDEAKAIIAYIGSQQ